MNTRIQRALVERRQNLAKGDKGFTLIELLVVVIIIGILAAIAIPVYIGVQNSASDSAAKSNLTNAKNAVVAWYTDTKNSGDFPGLDDSTVAQYGYKYDANDSHKVDAVGTVTLDGFCLTAVGASGNDFQITQDSSPTKGDCVTAP